MNRRRIDYFLIFLVVIIGGIVWFGVEFGGRVWNNVRMGKNPNIIGTMDVSELNLKKPRYQADIDVAGSVYDIRINDGPLLDDSEGHLMNTQVELNEWAQDGNNILSIELRPLPGEKNLPLEARITVAVTVRESGEGESDPHVIDTISFRDGVATADTWKNRPGGIPPRTKPIAGGGIRIEHDLPMHLTFAKWAWLNAPEIDNDDATIRSLMEETKRLHKILVARDVDAWETGLSELSRDLETASYVPIGSMRDGMRQSHEKYLKDPQLQSPDPPEEDLDLTLYGGGRLARLSSYGDPVLVLEDQKAHISVFFDYLFRRDASGKWVISRIKH
ncbi:MAG: hypothetical protein AAB652_03015 [Patescibacteria group bacterium]